MNKFLWIACAITFAMLLHGCDLSPSQGGKLINSLTFHKSHGYCWGVAGTHFFDRGYAGITVVPDELCEQNPEAQ